MTKLNQIIAIEKGAKTQAETEITKAYHAAQRTEIFNGLSKTYTPKDDEGETFPGEGVNVITTVPELVKQFSDALTRLFDVTATKVSANTLARADIVVDGDVLLEGVPVELLLFIEKRLGDCLVFLGKLPTLDPAQRWSENGNVGSWQTEPVITNRSKKVPRNHEKAPATDKHAAQVEVYYEDVTVGTWATTRFSGAAPAKQIQAWREKVLKLQAAVKMAREEANGIEVVDVKIGEKVFNFLFAE